ncbi:MAG: ubiquinol-cytochrome C chaperone-domain-containing protein [Linnemannia gamsii]|nr:MAG: ubiquinol-cytochrome C chaperone-domain-containing protein [Linnemannia gamsii]
MATSLLARSSIQSARSIVKAATPRSKPFSTYAARAFAASHTQAGGAPTSPATTPGSAPITTKESEEPKALTGFYGGFLRSLAKVTGHYTVSQTAMRSTHNFYEICAAQLQDKRSFWIDTCGLPDNFQTWFSITHLHVWLLMVRIRAEDHGKVFQQQLVNHFFHDIEDRMRYNHKISSGRIISTYMHDFLAQFHGGVLAYDEGMCKDDPIMAAALWRNLFTSSGNPAQIAILVDYVRKELQHLDTMSSDDFLESRNLFGTKAPALRGVPGV